MFLEVPFQSLPLRSVQLGEGFWSDINRKLLTQGLVSQWKHSLATGRLENFERVIRGETGTHEGYRFNDSDVYKLIEATACALVHGESAELLSYLDKSIDVLGRAQRPDGYMFTNIQLNNPDGAWTNIAELHEMYCAGHLIEAAVAVAENLEDQRLLVIAEKFAKHIQGVFGPGKRIGFCGHPELELALHRLADFTGEASYAETADWMVMMRGARPSPFEADFDRLLEAKIPAPSKFLYYKNGKYDGSYAQDHLPIVEQKSIEGHAVRAAYLYTAAARTASTHQDESLFLALTGLWTNTVQRRMYITGGIGSSHTNEGFTEDYDLPNEGAYAESCASIALALWGRAMFNVSGESSYIETVERALFNGVLSGISEDTKRYLYGNPLESRKNHERSEWFGCACCPPNLARVVASISAFAFGVSDQAVAIHFPVAARIMLDFGGQAVDLVVETDYPVSGKAKVRVETESPVSFKLLLRIPDWSEEVVTEIKGATEEAGFEGGYAAFDRTWSGGDTLEIDFNMTANWMEATPQIMSNAGRVALCYGPSLYCAETMEPQGCPQLSSVIVGEEPPAMVGRRADGSPRFLVPTTVTDLGFTDDAYAPIGTAEESDDELELLPYRNWGNKGKSYMQVWLRRG